MPGLIIARAGKADAQTEDAKAAMVGVDAIAAAVTAANEANPVQNGPTNAAGSAHHVTIAAMPPEIARNTAKPAVICQQALQTLPH